MTLHVGNADDRAEANHPDKTDETDQNGSDATRRFIVHEGRLDLSAARSVGRRRMDDHAGSGPDASAG